MIRSPNHRILYQDTETGEYMPRKRGKPSPMTDAVVDALRRVSNDPWIAYLRLSPKVGSYPLIYKYNPGNGEHRVPRELGQPLSNWRIRTKESREDYTQHEMCLRHCFAVSRRLQKEEAQKGTQQDNGTDLPQPSEAEDHPPIKAVPWEQNEHGNLQTAAGQQQRDQTAGSQSDHIIPPQQAKAKSAKRDPITQAKDWLKRIQTQIRPYVRERGFAEVSMRLSINGARLFLAMQRDPRAFKAMEHAIALAWPEDARRALNIEPFDPESVKGIPKVIGNGKSIDAGTHKLSRYVRMLESAKIPVCLVGPAGCGKSYLPAQIALQDDVPFGYVPMTAGASTTWLTGAYTLEGFITRPFPEIYSKGGIFLWDEMDAADPNMLLLVNNALSNDSWENPANGRTLKKHENFRPFAAMNTFGTGANRRYVGRERLDMATLDRWATGMIEMDYDNELERRIFESIIAEEEETKQ